MESKRDSAKEMSEKMRNVVDHAQALVDATAGDLGDRVKSARAALKDHLDSAKSDFGGLEEQLKAKVQATDTFLHEKPYYAIGGAGIAGLILGWLMSRK